MTTVPLGGDNLGDAVTHRGVLLVRDSLDDKMGRTQGVRRAQLSGVPTNWLPSP